MFIEIGSNTFVVAVYEWDKLVRFQLPMFDRSSYPRTYSDNGNFSNVQVPVKEVLMRASQARKLGFSGFSFK